MTVPAKYIVFDTPLSEVPIVFPGQLDHSTIATTLQYSHPDWTLISAGNVDFNVISIEGTITKLGEMKAQCYGRSVSLNLTARHEDSMLINGLFCG